MKKGCENDPLTTKRHKDFLERGGKRAARRKTTGSESTGERTALIPAKKTQRKPKEGAPAHQLRKIAEKAKKDEPNERARAEKAKALAEKRLARPRETSDARLFKAVYKYDGPDPRGVGSQMRSEACKWMLSREKGTSLESLKNTYLNLPGVWDMQSEKAKEFKAAFELASKDPSEEVRRCAVAFLHAGEPGVALKDMLPKGTPIPNFPVSDAEIASAGLMTLRPRKIIPAPPEPPKKRRSKKKPRKGKEL